MLKNKNTSNSLVCRRSEDRVYKKILWNAIPLLIVVVLTAWLVAKVQSANIHLHWDKIPWDLYPKCIVETLRIAAISSLLGVLIGIPLGIGRTRNNCIVTWVCNIYIEIIKGIPLLVQLLMLWGVLTLFVTISNYNCGIIVLSLYGSVKAGILVEQAVNSFSTNKQTTENITYNSNLPLIKAITCIFLYLYIHLIRESSLLSIIGVHELLSFTRYGMENYAGLTAIIPVIISYTMLYYTLTQLSNFMRIRFFDNKLIFEESSIISL